MNRHVGLIKLLLMLTLGVMLLGNEATPVIAQDTTPGTIVVYDVDGNGNPLQRACWFLQTTEGRYLQNACDIEGGAIDSTTILANVAPGTYQLLENHAPPGYLAGHRQEVAVAPGQTVEVTRTDDPGGQTLTIYRTDEAGAPLLGGCVQIFKDAGGGRIGDFFVVQCDDFEGSVDGVTEIAGLPPGKYVASEYNLPAGYVTSREPFRQVTIRAGEDAELTFADRQGGTLAVLVVDENGAPLPTSCFTLRAVNPGEREQSVWSGCDYLDSANDGVVTFQNLAVGDYTLEQTFVARGHLLPETPTSIALVPGDNQATIRDDTGGLDLILDATGEKKEAVTGSCFALYRTAEEKQAFSPAASGCDAYDGETDGRTALAGLETGDYFLVQTFADATHTVASDRAVTLTKGKNRKLTIQDAVGGTLVLTVDNGKGKRLPGTCFALTAAAKPDPSNATSYWCDSFDGKDDGTVTLGGLPAGDFFLIQTLTPRDRATAAPVQVSVELGKRRRVKISDTAVAQTTSIAVVDEKKQPVTGACFVAYVDAGGGKRGDIAAMACDWDDTFDGSVHFSGLAPGDYVLAQTFVYDPYTRAGDRPITVAKGKNRKFTVENATGGTVVVSVADEKGKRVAGGCFALLDAAHPDANSPVKSACDASDQKRDGKVTLAGLATGDYLLVQTATPAKRLAAPAQTVAVELGKKQQVKLTNATGGRPVSVAVADADEQPVVGGCFLLYADTGAGKRGAPVAATCDAYDATDGTATFSGLAPGSYVLVHTSAPAGHDLAADQPVTVTDDQPTAVSIVEVAAPTQATREASPSA